jgi:thioredoxin reductase (NADPH)
MIIVYSKTNCPQCDRVKQLLTQHNITFDVKMVDKDPAIRNWLVQQGHKSVPQVYDNDTLLGGYTALMAQSPEFFEGLANEAA